MGRWVGDSALELGCLLGCLLVMASATRHVLRASRYVVEGSDRVFSGIQPTGVVQVGNYLGAVSQWLALQSEVTPGAMYVSVVDLHAMTGAPSGLGGCAVRTGAMLLAAGVDPDKTVLYVQSAVKEHAELAWVLGSVTPHGWLGKMTQWKDKTASGAPRVLGLFSYPVLQAADILLYNANLVPVGEDQVQHIELARDIASRMNSVYGTQIELPRVLLDDTAPRIMSLNDPSSKMSKSNPLDRSRLNMDDSRDVIAAKIRKAPTDSERGIWYDEEARPNVASLLRLFAALGKRSVDDVVAQVGDYTTSQFKDALTEEAAGVIDPIREEYLRLVDSDLGYVERVLAEGGERARVVAAEGMRGVMDAVKNKR